MDRRDDLTLERLDTPLGDMLVVSAGGVVRAIDFADCEDRLQRMLGRHLCTPPRDGGAGGGVGHLDAGGTLTLPRNLPQGEGRSEAVSRLSAYFAGDLQAIVDIRIATAGTPFQQRVWSALRGIPPGVRTTYGQLAAALGQAAGGRAIGLANGANPVSIVIPCHRLTGADGTLTGYAGGLHRKAWLLAHEAGVTPPALPARPELRFPAPPT